MPTNCLGFFKNRSRSPAILGPRLVNPSRRRSAGTGVSGLEPSYCQRAANLNEASLRQLRSSRRQETQTAFAIFQIGPPDVGCYTRALASFLLIGDMSVQ